MLTVSADQDDVEGRLGAGGLACPACSGVLARWGWARERDIRGPGGVAVRVRLRRAVAMAAGGRMCCCR
jgi:hypothetical protein